MRQLSGGQLRRVEIARALLHRPRLLLLDEPTVGLDIGSRQGILDHVRRLCAEEGLGVLWATHLIDEVQADDQVIVLHQGRIRALGDGAAICAKAEARRSAPRVHQADSGGARGMSVASLRPRRLAAGAPAASTLGHYLRAARYHPARGAALPPPARAASSSALVRPLVWLFIFAAGFRSVLGVSIIPPYETYVLYEVYITPGLLGMILLFTGMQSSLVDGLRPRDGQDARAAGQPVAALVPACLASCSPASLVACCRSTSSSPSPGSGTSSRRSIGYLTVLPALLLAGLMLGALGLLLSSVIRQLENFAGVMNFVIFPMFFASSALYPLWRMRESSVLLCQICAANPFTHAVELIRFALYGQFELSLRGDARLHVVFLGIAVVGYDPGRGFMEARRGA